MTSFKKIFGLLTPPERRNAILLMIMILVMAFLDMLGVASILPFVAVLANPDLIHTNIVLNAAFVKSRDFGVNTTEQFLFVLGILVFLIFIASLAFKALTTYVQIRFTFMREFSIGKRLVEGYLHQPYEWFLNRHGADLGKTVLSEVGAVIDNGIFPLMTVIAQATVVMALLVLLLIVDPFLALSIGLILGLAYASIFAAMSGWLKRLGLARGKANQARFTILSEAFGAVKELKVNGLEQAYIARFAKPAEIFANRQTIAILIGQLPRYLMEAIAFGGMLILILYLLAKSGNFAGALPMVALYVFAGYRLMPALQQIYSALSQLRFVGPALEEIYNDINNLQPTKTTSANFNPLPLTTDIRLTQVCYKYPDMDQPALNKINITIPVHSTVGFVGATGSGKTTVVDLILGLLDPQEGCLRIDGQILTLAERRQWQNSIGYVPQHIYLIDDTISANIAFGVKTQDINQHAVERAAKIANLHGFVINDLPHGYATTVGERGVRLSGGQRQRIGIARALYRNPQVLILDEATSALDNFTEKAVMDAINNLENETTIILIAHRLSTVRQCDLIYLLERGEVKACGSYEQLKISNIQFAAMADMN